MADTDPLGNLLDPRTISGSVASILQIPDPSGSVDIDYSDNIITQTFALLGKITHRHPDINNPGIETPEWAEAYRN
jgi:hypothetical protein